MGEGGQARGRTTLPRTSIARESPQLPTIICVFVTKAVIAVLPLWSSPPAISGSARNSASVWRKP